MDLGDEEGGLALFQIILAKADKAEAFLQGAVEEHMEIGHVHMAVIVDPGRRDPIVDDTNGAKKKTGVRSFHDLSLVSQIRLRCSSHSARNETLAQFGSDLCMRVRIFLMPSVAFATVLVGMDDRASQRDLKPTMNAPHSASVQKPSDAPSPPSRPSLRSASATGSSTSAAVREQHGHTLTWVKNQPPDLVVYPRTTQEVSEIVKLCAAHDVPDRPLRHRHVSRGARQRALRRRFHRY